MAYENFDIYTEGADEGNDIVKTDSNTLTFTTFDAIDVTGYWYKDHGVGHFGGDFDHKFECQFSNFVNPPSAVFVYFWGMSNTVGDLHAAKTAGDDGCGFGVYSDTPQLWLRVLEAGSWSEDKWLNPGPQLSTTYYVNAPRDDDGGANSTGQYVAYIRTGSHTGTLRDTLTVDASAGEQNDFRYYFPISSADYNGGADTVDGFSQNHDLQEVVDLTIQDPVHGHIIDVVSAQRVKPLIVMDSVHEQISDKVSFTRLRNLSPIDSIHSQILDKVSPTRLRNIDPTDSIHDQVADKVLPTRLRNLSVQEPVHDQIVDRINAQRVKELLIQQAIHAQITDSIVPTRTRRLSIRDAISSQVVDVLGLQRLRTLTVQDAIHDHFTDRVAITRLTPDRPIALFTAKNVTQYFVAINLKYRHGAKNEAFYFVAKDAM